MAWYLHACPNCGGDLYEDPLDRGWVTCVLCARTYRRPSATDRRVSRTNSGPSSGDKPEAA